MSNLKKTALAFLVAITSHLSAQTIRGTVWDSYKNETIPFAEVQLINPDNTVKANTRCDMDGNFKLIKIPAGVYSVKAGYIGYKDSTFTNIKVVRDVTFKFDMHRPCKYDGSLSDKTCPVCHKKDMTIPISFDTPPKGKKLNDDSGTTYYTDDNPTDCDPHWFCKRDKVKY